MTLADLTAAEWGAIITAIGSGAAVVIAAIFTGWRYVQMEANKTLLALEKVRAATAKVESTRLVREQAETIKEMDAALNQRSEEVRREHDQKYEAAVQLASWKVRFEMIEKRLTEQDKLLQECEDDRRKLWQALRDCGHLPPRPDPKGGAS